MHDERITAVETRDVRFPLLEGAGSDAIHSGSEYAFATTLITTEARNFGTGIVLTLGNGNQLVCRAIEMLAQKLIGRDVELAKYLRRARARVPSLAKKRLHPHSMRHSAAGWEKMYS